MDLTIPQMGTLPLLYTFTQYELCGTFNKFPDFFVQAFKIVVDF